jgi:hypothetical protein
LIEDDLLLEDIMIESEIIASGCVKGILSGKHYNRAMRIHKLLYEAMERLCLEAFVKSLTTEKKAKLDSLEVILTEDPNLDAFLENCSSHGVNKVKEMYDKFVNERSEVNPLFAFWSKYIEMVQLLLLHIRATRTTDWSLHLSTLRSMIPWFFATDRVNYSRYALCYWMEMMCLEQTNPCTYNLGFGNLLHQT